jgi:hypothetical protein
MGELRDLLMHVAELLWLGRIAEALPFRQRLLTQVKAGELGSLDRVARARAAQLSLVMIERKGAVAALAPFLDADGHPNKDAVAELRKERDGLGAGLVLSQLANLMFRKFQAQLGDQLAEAADRCFAENRADHGPNDIELARMENRVFWARLRWRAGKQRQAEAELDRTIEQLHASLTMQDDGGRQVLLGCACDLKATFEQNKGHDGRRWSYEAIYLLEQEPIRDPIRLAHALYALGRSEASHRRGALMPAVGLLNRAAELFHAVDHPFRERAQVQLATVYAKAEMPAEANQVLESINFPSTADGDEARWVEADRLLLLNFLAENNARRDQRLWPTALKTAEKLFAPELGDLPPRIDAERHLHRGIALTHTRGDAPRTRDVLQKARTIATSNQMQRINVAACLAIVEHGLLRGDNWADLQDVWLEADVLLGSINSTYLAQWRERLTKHLAPSHYFVRVPVVDKLEDAKTRFVEEYVRYHWERSHHNLNEFAEAIGLGRAQAYRLTESMRPPRPRRPSKSPKSKN